MDKWIVHKFGGSSVADADCFRRVADIVEASPHGREAVVLSACRGVTDALLNAGTSPGQPGGDLTVPRARGRIQGGVLWIDARQVILVEWGPPGPTVQWADSERNLEKLVPAEF